MQKKIDEFLLSQEEKSLLPFQGGEVITYCKPNGTLANSYTANAPELTTIEGHSDHAQSDSWIVEQLRLELSNETGEMVFFIKSNKPDLSTQFNYMWGNHQEGFPDVFGSCLLPIDTTETDTERIIGDLLIGEKTYHDVFVADVNFPSSYNDTVFEGLAYPLNFYFSPNYGIIKMDFSDSTYWELESIEW